MRVPEGKFPISLLGCGKLDLGVSAAKTTIERVREFGVLFLEIMVFFAKNLQNLSLKIAQFSRRKVPILQLSKSGDMVRFKTF